MAFCCSAQDTQLGKEVACCWLQLQLLLVVENKMGPVLVDKKQRLNLQLVVAVWCSLKMNGTASCLQLPLLVAG